jgi:hypothetical protein
MWMFLGPGIALVLLTIFLVVTAIKRREPPLTSGVKALLIVGAVLTAIGSVFAFLLAWMSTWTFAHGRPLRVAGRPRRARTRPREGWHEGALPAEIAVPGERAAAAEGWRRAAEDEHASIPAFGRLAEELIAVGAPAALVEGCHRAALDEVRHARRAYAIASRHAGRELGPDVLPAASRRRLFRRVDLATLAAESLADGAINEGTVAAALAAAVPLAVDPVIRETLEATAADEAAHAALAWQVIDYCVEAGGPRVVRALEKTLSRERSRRLPEGAADLEAHGLPSARRLAACRAEILLRASERLRVEPDEEAVA